MAVIDMELEAVLRPPEVQLPPYPPKVILLANGDHLVIRQVRREDVPVLLQAVRPICDISRNFSDLIGARLYAELLAWYRFRMRGGYCLIGQVDGRLVGIMNGRVYSPKIGINFHTLEIDRRLRTSQHLFAAKMEYHIEIIGQEEVWTSAENPIQFRKWMVEYALERKPDAQHELAGCPSYRLTREHYLEIKDRMVTGQRPVPRAMMETAVAQIILPDDENPHKKGGREA